mmetsp:Transcript_100488/g.239631  ORF Transcript_100488/g.239631 Transcript_100488/m.239631 type:complete len:266 (-) Transcript_100488:429-1226(-)
MQGIALPVPAEARTQAARPGLAGLLHRLVTHELLQHHDRFHTAQHQGAAGTAGGLFHQVPKEGHVLQAPVEFLGTLFGQGHLLLFENSEASSFQLGFNRNQVGNGIRLDDAESPLELQAAWEDGLDLLVCCFHVDAGMDGVAGAVGAPQGADGAGGALAGCARVQWPADQLQLANSAAPFQAHCNASSIACIYAGCACQVWRSLVLLAEKLGLLLAQPHALLCNHEEAQGSRLILNHLLHGLPILVALDGPRLQHCKGALHGQGI